ncbi:RsmE family RNA methyltransferase, partial [Leucobacter sp. M11]|uniref:RsmE family RNA methyltransferase n=1 Tax=Leucobacter sp. M11 TaxID=2993565 RepID=UPI002D7FD6AE
GVDGVLPWQATRSVSRWNAEKRAKGVERWRAIVREAAKQSLRARIPEILTPVDSRELAAWAAGRTVLVLHPGAAERLSALPREVLEGAAEVALVVGPEGGLSPEELDALTAAGARTVSLGDTVLRTSSAGPAALAVLNVRLGRW